MFEKNQKGQQAPSKSQPPKSLMAKDKLKEAATKNKLAKMASSKIMPNQQEKLQKERLTREKQNQTIKAQKAAPQSAQEHQMLDKAKHLMSKKLRNSMFYKRTYNFDFDAFERSARFERINGIDRKVVANVDDLVLYYKNPAKPKEKNLVIRGASFSLYEGEVHAIIGESGSGKSVITSALYGLPGDQAVIHHGTLKLYNHEVQNYSPKEWERSKIRGKVISAIFQNPMSTLNPTMKIGKQIMEGMLVNKIVKTKKEAYEKAITFLKYTKIYNPEEVMKMYPHELSGGMVQRVVIASIVSLKPKILVMDEPTTALDPTVQAYVLEIISELQKRFKISIIFITHDLGVVAALADRISIMYAGQIVETGTRDEILNNPLHPYTWGLIMSSPDINKGTRLKTIPGSVPSTLNNITGDAFAVRNEYALDVDLEYEPLNKKISETHFVKSWLYDEKAPAFEPPELIKQKWAEWNEKHPSESETLNGQGLPIAKMNQKEATLKLAV